MVILGNAAVRSGVRFTLRLDSRVTDQPPSWACSAPGQELFDHPGNTHYELRGWVSARLVGKRSAGERAGCYADACDASGSSIGSTHCARQAGGSHGSPK